MDLSKVSPQNIMTNLLAGVTGEMVLALHLLVRTRETLRNNLIQEPVMGKEIRM